MQATVADIKTPAHALVLGAVRIQNLRTEHTLALKLQRRARESLCLGHLNLHVPQTLILILVIAACHHHHHLLVWERRSGRPSSALELLHVQHA